MTMQFDFTNFAARVAELNRLHKLVHELSDLRLRTGKAEDIERWEKAVKDWKEFSGFGYRNSVIHLLHSFRFSVRRLHICSEKPPLFSKSAARRASWRSSR